MPFNYLSVSPPCTGLSFLAGQSCPGHAWASSCLHTYCNAYRHHPRFVSFAFVGAGLGSVIEAQRAANADALATANVPSEFSTGDLITLKFLPLSGSPQLLALIPCCS